MKKSIVFKSLLFLFSIVTLISCETEPLDPAINLNDFNPSNPNNPNNPNAAGTFKATFDGQNWAANTTQAIVNDDYIAITGLNSASGDFFQITIPFGTTGTYNWANVPSGSLNSFGLIYSPGNGQVPYIGLSTSDGAQTGYTNYTDTAEIIVSSINTTTKVITGTFKFTGVRFDSTLTSTQTKVFTSGEFSLNYTDNTTSPSTNSFFAKIDGVDFNATNVNANILSGKINIIGRRGNIENIGINVPQNIIPGTYDLDFFEGTYVGIYVMDNTGTNNFASDTGTVIITSHNTSTKNLIGTFNFIGEELLSGNTKNITQGSFNVTYQ